MEISMFKPAFNIKKMMKQDSSSRNRRLAGVGLMAGSLGVGSPYTYSKVKRGALAMVESSLSALGALEAKKQKITNREIAELLGSKHFPSTIIIRKPAHLERALPRAGVNIKYLPQLQAQMYGGIPFIMPGKKRNILAVGSKVNPGSLRHEIGHIKDFGIMKDPNKQITNRIAILSGNRGKKHFIRDVLAEEHRAWRNVPKELKRGLKGKATASYKNMYRMNRNFRAAKIGGWATLAALGLGAGLALYPGRKKPQTKE